MLEPKIGGGGIYPGRAALSPVAAVSPGVPRSPDRSVQARLIQPPDIPKWRDADSLQVLAVDLVNRPASVQARTHKLKKIVPEPNSFFMDVKCPGCFAITTVFSHASTVVQCQGCATALCQPTGGKAKLTEGCSFRRKN
ncbi:40S ribosomal protein S27 [Cryptococcus wingfieldii CBS 7118]|uniref:40S ribosomal protein S27 n=1 Tax=Cryptococcus wingfieldii CBS 7118 TaxID=1295528 RepID=A0A1E3K5W6_9TREE|nr:40S ribosomal protein S27 [Cryptococcus wingfieldii CBS 7118]ODO08479.1 40S ribosomal protein S27 [Cryptococcus wingfieldii CBS 7118]